MKQQFTRRLGMLLDMYIDSAGANVLKMLRVTECGGALSNEERSEVLEHIAKARSFLACLALQDQPPSSDHLKALLLGLERGLSLAPISLARMYAGCEGVFCALARAFENASGGWVESTANALVCHGGDEVAPILRRRFEGVRAEKEDRTALEAVAQALLVAEPYATDAAEALARLAAKSASASVVHKIGKLLGGGLLERGPRRVLEPVIIRLYKKDASRAFSVAPLWYIKNDPDLAFKHCVGLLADDRNAAFGAEMLVRLKEDGHDEARVRLEAWLKETQFVRAAIEVVVRFELQVHDRRSVRLSEMALGDMSPSLRVAGVKLLTRDRGPSADNVAEDALNDEPDPIMRELLVTARSAGSLAPLTKV